MISMFFNKRANIEYQSGKDNYFLSFKKCFPLKIQNPDSS